jgi:hypothetical protein
LNTCLYYYGLLNNPVLAHTSTQEKKGNFPIEADPGDVFRNLKFGVMAYFEASTKKWAATSDFVFMNLENDVTPEGPIVSGTVAADQGVWEAAGLYRVASFLEVGAGGRLNHLQTGIEVLRRMFPSGADEVAESYSAAWHDPILIARLSADIRDKRLFQFRGDLGGFGLGSDFTWQLQAYAGHRFAKLIQLTTGYGILSIDNDKGTGAERFVFDIDGFGPLVRLGFHF